MVCRGSANYLLFFSVAAMQPGCFGLRSLRAHHRFPNSLLSVTSPRLGPRHRWLEMNDLFFFFSFFIFPFKFFSFHLFCLLAALVLSLPLTFLLFSRLGVVSLSGDDGLPMQLVTSSHTQSRQCVKDLQLYVILFNENSIEMLRN